MLHPTPSDPDPLPPTQDGRVPPSRTTAAQRRAMQAAMANAVRAMKSAGGRHSATPRRDRPPPPAAP